MELDWIAVKEWQELIGAAVGAFLAVIGSLITYAINSANEERKQRKEFLRQIEISITRSMQDTFIVGEQLRYFTQRAGALVTTVRSYGPNAIVLERINFPTVREVYRDLAMPSSKLKSYYLHNKVMWVDAAIRDINETAVNLKNDFENLIRQNETLIALMKEDPNPSVPRDAYAENLEIFIRAIDDFRTKSLDQIIKIMMQVKVYNNAIRKPCGFMYRWRHEGIGFNFFCWKFELVKVANDLDAIEPIDMAIEADVLLGLRKADKRKKKIAQEVRAG